MNNILFFLTKKIKILKNNIAASLFKAPIFQILKKIDNIKKHVILNKEKSGGCYVH